MGKDSIYCRYIKRIFDICCALAAIILLFWLYLIIAILVRLKMGSPIIFIQERPGQIDSKTGKEKIFKLYKFRSMTDKRDSDGNLLPDKDRLTKFGRFLRATSLDELPEVWNILKGDMSVVGPRPWLVKYLDYYTDFERKRQYVRPGLTGLSQVSGRNSVTWAQRFMLDAQYTETVSFGLDLKIIFMTLKKVFVRDGIEFIEGHQSIMEYFESRSELITTNKK